MQALPPCASANLRIGCFLLELQVPMGAIWYHLVSPNENVAGSELVM